MSINTPSPSSQEPPHKCPDPACQGNIREIREWIWGHLGSNGANKNIQELQAEMRTKLTVSWRRVLAAVSIVVIPAIVTVANIWAMQQISPYRFADAKTVAEQNRRISIVEVNSEAVQQSLDQVQATQREIQRDIKELLKRSAERGND